MAPESIPLHALRQPAGFPRETFEWSLPQLAGRVTEISGDGDGAPLTLACALVLDAQCRQEPVVWVGPPETIFYPPDIAECGVDLNALVVIRTPRLELMVRSVDRLLRSAAFGLVIVDLPTEMEVPLPVLARLSGLTRRHHSALVFLRETRSGASLGPLVSLAITTHRRAATDRFDCWLEVVKNKQGTPALGRVFHCRGPAGLRYPS